MRNQAKNHITQNDTPIKLCLFFVTFFLHAVVAVQLRMLHISTDEFGVLASAAFFTGEDWSALSRQAAFHSPKTSPELLQALA